MLELANDRRRFGSPRLHELLRREELVQNHKRTERIYQEENLSLRTRKRVKRPSHARIVQAGPAGPDEQWAMDFVSDSLMGGRRIRILTIADLWDRSSPALEVDMSLPGVRVVRVVVSRIFRTFCSSQSVKHGFVSSLESSDLSRYFLVHVHIPLRTPLLPSHIA